MLKDILRASWQPMRNINNATKLIKGLKHFKKTHLTPEDAYQAMIQLHGQTNGRSTRYLAHHFSKLNPKPAYDTTKSSLFNFSENEVSSIVKSIQDNGFYKFDQIMPENVCADIENAVNEMEANTWINGQHKVQKFNPKTPEAQVYKYEESALVKVPSIQNIMADPAFQNISAQYINANPVLCSVNSWHSSCPPKNNDDHGGQQFHFDMSRAKWLNFFVYLSDVGPENGPHCYVHQSHHFNNKKAKKLLKKGYVRIPDEDIQKAYGEDKMVELTGPRGTIIAVDTIGFHRGKPPLSGFRLMFEIIYSSSLFGGTYDQVKLPEQMTSKLKKALREKPYIYQKYLSSNA